MRVTIKWRATQTFPSVRRRKTINAGLDRLWGLHPLSNTAGLWEMLVPRIGAFCLELSLCGWSGQSQLEAPSSLLSFSFSKRRGFSNMTLYRLDSTYQDHMIPRSVNLNTWNEAKWVTLMLAETGSLPLQRKRGKEKGAFRIHALELILKSRKGVSSDLEGKLT